MNPHMPHPVSEPASLLDRARRRSVGESTAHVDAPYTRTVLGDAAKNRNRWERHPHLARALDLGLLTAVVIGAWIIAVALAGGLWHLTCWAF